MKLFSRFSTHTHRILQAILILGIVGVLLWACEKEKFPSFWKSSNEFKEYQSWFENQYSEILEFSLTGAKSVRTDQHTILVKPEWALARHHVVAGSYNYLEVPLRTNGILKLNNSESLNQVGLTRLVIRENRRSGQKGAYFITLLADEEYLENQSSEYLNNSLANISDKFSGSILIQTIKGEYVAGTMVKKGNRLGNLILKKFQFQKSAKINTRSPCIYKVTVYVYYVNKYQLTLESEVAGQPQYFGPKEIDDGITVETGEFYVNNCDQNNDDDIDPNDPWKWVSGNISSPTPTPNPCDGANIVDGALEFAPTTTWTTEKSGTYGCVRTGGSGCSGCGGSVPGYNKCHRGFDIKSPIGGNVYSMHHGKVIFNGIKNGLGKTVGVRSEVNGQNVVLYYGHLQSGLVYEDDLVPAGTLIGKSGDTGNAAGVTYPHVHIRVADGNGNGHLDPTSYVNFSYSINSGGAVNISSCN